MPKYGQDVQSGNLVSILVDFSPAPYGILQAALLFPARVG